MTSCAGASWDSGKTDGMEPGTEVGKPGGRFWCRAGCPMPGDTGHGGQAAQGRQWALQAGQAPPCPQASQTLLNAAAQGQRPAPAPSPHQAGTQALPLPLHPAALAALTIGVSPHPQGGAAGAGQPGGVGRVRVGGWVAAQLAALQRGAAGDHEVRG